MQIPPLPYKAPSSTVHRPHDPQHMHMPRMCSATECLKKLHTPAVAPMPWTMPLQSSPCAVPEDEIRSEGLHLCTLGSPETNEGGQPASQSLLTQPSLYLKANCDIAGATACSTLRGMSWQPCVYRDVPLIMSTRFTSCTLLGRLLTSF